MLLLLSALLLMSIDAQSDSLNVLLSAVSVALVC